MVTESAIGTITNPFFITSFLFLIKIGLIVLSILYFIFSLFVVRQVGLMTETVETEAAPLLRGLSIIHAGLSLGLIVLFIGFL